MGYGSGATGAGRPRGISAAASGLGSGYYHGAPPIYGGSGSGMGPKGAGGTTTRPSTQWHPTIAYLLGLIAVELAGYCALRYLLEKHGAHGG